MKKVRPISPPNSLNTMPTAKRPSMANRPIMKIARNMSFSETVTCISLRYTCLGSFRIGRQAERRGNRSWRGPHRPRQCRRARRAGRFRHGDQRAQAWRGIARRRRNARAVCRTDCRSGARFCGRRSRSIPVVRRVPRRPDRNPRAAQPAREFSRSRSAQRHKGLKKTALPTARWLDAGSCASWSQPSPTASARCSIRTTEPSTIRSPQRARRRLRRAARGSRRSTTQLCGIDAGRSSRDHRRPKSGTAYNAARVILAGGAWAGQIHGARTRARGRARVADSSCLRDSATAPRRLRAARLRRPAGRLDDRWQHDGERRLRRRYHH